MIDCLHTLSFWIYIFYNLKLYIYMIVKNLSRYNSKLSIIVGFSLKLLTLICIR